MSDAPYWKTTPLDRMTRAEWEGLCDGCGLCCLHKVEDVDNGAIGMTDVACGYLDLGSCRCTDYANRKRNVPDCVQLKPEKVLSLRWLPSTCAYRLVALSQDLPAWHYLVSGDPDSVHTAGISARGRAVSEDEVDDIEEHVVAWLNRGRKRTGA